MSDNINDNMFVRSPYLKIYNYSLLGDDFSMSKADLRNIFRDTVDYYHFAASLKYNERSCSEIFSANIKGLENSIEVFSKYATNNSRFIYIGTAYSCGRDSEVFKEKYYKNQEISAFRNYYEQSKRFAENIIKNHIQKNGLNAHIIRLSQVVGDQRTGITKTDYGIFDFAKRIYSLANRYPGETIRVQVDPDCTQNLIPVNTVTAHLIKVTEENEVPPIMNFVSKNSVRNSRIIEMLNQLIPIHVVPVKKLNQKDMTPIERLISAGMSFTQSYTSTSISFDSSQRDKFIGYEETGPDEKSIAKMLEYFIETLPVKKKKSEAA